MISLIILSLVGLFIMLSGLINVSNIIATIVCIAALTCSAALFILDWNTMLIYYNDMLFFDNYALSFSILLCIITIFVFLASKFYFHDVLQYANEHLALFIFSLTGMIMIVAFDHLSMLFIGIEVMSIPLYILAGSRKKSLSSNEASLKYFLMGAFATGLLLMGITLVYGETGSFHVQKIAESVSNLDTATQSPLLILGIAFLLAGMGFKISAVPFHFWTPDVYQGAPTLVTMFMSTAVKIAGFASFYRLLTYCFMQAGEVWAPIISVIALLTISVGSITAMYQTSAKRMLAYSSISHAGYMLLLFLSTDTTSANLLLYYAFAYAFSSIVAFSVIEAVQKTVGNDEFEAFNGLAKLNPLTALFMTVAMISMAGIPITGGFFAKFYALSTGIDSGYMWIVIPAIINAIIGVYYYFKIIIAMYFKEKNVHTNDLEINTFQNIVLIKCTIITLLLGLFPDFVFYLF
ncbi:MAG: NADH-quinone oxidoreductase subunit N [Cytophagales bacterium]|nr:NADH-quinone oxidoreductase subunit N [Cytophagales bacterium]